MKHFLSYLGTKILFGSLVLASCVFQTALPISPSELARDSVNVPSPPIELATTAADALNEIGDPEIIEATLSTPLVIKAINPGYTVDGIRDVGEFIELQNLTDTSLSLAGYSLSYVNSSGKATALVSFSEGSSMVGEFLLLRLARTANSDEAELTYMTTVAMSSSALELSRDGEVVDRVCWSKDIGCNANFSSNKPTTLVRDTQNGEFSHQEEYVTHFDAAHPTLILPVIEDEDDEAAEISARCQGLEFSEILSFYTADATEQFVELYNSTDHEIELTGCSLRYKNKVYALTGTVAADGYYAYYPVAANLTLTKNPSSSNDIELLDANGQLVDLLTYPHGQKKSTSYARFYDATLSEVWDLTYAPTPGAENFYQEFRSCPEGKVINPETGNCINATTSTLTECPEGKYRNPLTGRCKNIESSTNELQPCAEGYERNPETNRCRKITADNDGAGYALVPNTSTSKTTFVALGAVISLVSVGAIYIVLQYRHEIARAARKARQRIHQVRKNLIARGIGFHRHK